MYVCMYVCDDGNGARDHGDGCRNASRKTSRYYAPSSLFMSAQALLSPCNELSDGVLRAMGLLAPESKDDEEMGMGFSSSNAQGSFNVISSPLSYARSLKTTRPPVERTRLDRAAVASSSEVQRKSRVSLNVKSSTTATAGPSSSFTMPSFGAEVPVTSGITAILILLDDNDDVDLDRAIALSLQGDDSVSARPPSQSLAKSTAQSTYSQAPYLFDRAKHAIISANATASKEALLTGTSPGRLGIQLCQPSFVPQGSTGSHSSYGRSIAAPGSLNALPAQIFPCVVLGLSSEAPQLRHLLHRIYSLLCGVIIERVQLLNPRQIPVSSESLVLQMSSALPCAWELGFDLAMG